MIAEHCTSYVYTNMEILDCGTGHVKPMWFAPKNMKYPTTTQSKSMLSGGDKKYDIGSDPLPPPFEINFDLRATLNYLNGPLVVLFRWSLMSSILTTLVQSAFKDFSLTKFMCYTPSKHHPDFHLPQSQISIVGPDFHLRQSQKCVLVSMWKRPTT